MAKSILLEDISVVKHCPASWKHMVGNDQVRHCTHCNRNVYNLSNMTREEANRVVQDAGDRICTQFYRRRKDGMIMTKPCGFIAKSKRGFLRALSASLAVFGLSVIFTPTFAGQTKTSARLTTVRMLQKYKSRLAVETDQEMRQYYQERIAELQGQSLLVQSEH